MANKKVQLIFNKISGAYIGSVLFKGSSKKTEDLPPPEHEAMIYKLVNMDLDVQIWEGDYSTGKIVLKSDGKEINEYHLNSNTSDYISERYKSHQQINILTDMVNLLLDKLEIKGEERESFNSMVNYIKNARSDNDREKEKYTNHKDYDYIDDEELADRMDKKLEGGLRELVKPRK